MLGIPPQTLRNRYEAALARGITSAPVLTQNIEAQLKQQVQRLTAELRRVNEQDLETEFVRSKIIGLRDAVNAAPDETWHWDAKQGVKTPGVPTLFLSDLHWGEVVKGAQIMRKNEYSPAIARERMKTLIESAIHLCNIVDPKFRFPGIVVPLGGDMISGNIHEELMATNELNSMPAVLDLYSVLVAAITRLADAFGAVRLPCVTGNHGRDTHKIWHKDRHATSFDWLLYNFLAKHFENDKRVRFYIPDGPDAHYRIFGHRYLLTHGDQFRGGDGMIGALGPIIRGDHKKRSRNSQIGLDYDTMICGHWHQYMHLTRLIVNGSLKGYDEYAFNSNFPFERPQQALWLTHPKYGITYRMPVYVSDAPNAAVPPNWTSME